jgi:hypothetical protein
VDGAREHEAMANVFARGAVVARSESSQLPGFGQRLTDAIHIVKEFAEQATPGLALESV